MVCTVEALSMPTILEDYIGLPIAEIPTPALMIDVDVLEKNLARIETLAVRVANCTVPMQRHINRRL